MPLTTQQAATALGISRGRVLKLIAAGRLTATKWGRDWVIEEANLEAVRVRRPGRPYHNAPKAAHSNGEEGRTPRRCGER